jgi:hypothetical protein
MNLTLLNEWMQQWKQERKEMLLDMIQLEKDIYNAQRQQSILNVISYEKELKENEIVIPFTRNYSGLKIAKNHRLEEYEDYSRRDSIHRTDIISTYVVRGLEVEHSHISYPKRYDMTLKMIEKLGYSQSDYSQVYQMSRTIEWAEEKAEKDMQRHKKSIEQKVLKICGDTITHVNDSTNTIFVKGSNDKIAKIYAIHAGGYNIQRLHIRVLVKEVKSYEV